MNDNYDHGERDLMYVIENIPGPPDSSDEYKEILDDFNHQIANSCSCYDTCGDDCQCVQSSGGFNYEINSLNGKSMKRLNNNKNIKIYPIQECNNLCRCPNTCGNRLVQYGPLEGLIVKQCEENSKGLGLYTENTIPKGSFVCEYAGEVITETEALLRQSIHNSENKMNYIYCLNEHCLGKITQTFIDPSKFGNIGRYINHSCNPNCTIVPVRVDSLIPKLAIFSNQDILPNTELTFDYGDNNRDSIHTDSVHSKDIVRKQCLCNSDNCKKWMPFNIY